MQRWLEETLRQEYRLIRVLRENTDSGLYRMRHRTLDRDVVVRRQNGGSAEVYRRLSRLQSPHLPAVYAVTEREGVLVVVEEFIDGITLYDQLQTAPLTRAGAERVAVAVLKALYALHQNDIIHRDVKLSNIMIEKTGVVKLIDFHISRIYKPLCESDTRYFGTVGYAAPEQEAGVAQTSPQSDIYSFGVLLNLLLTGAHPSHTLYKTGRLGRIIRRCIHVNPAQRFGSAEEILRQVML